MQFPDTTDALELVARPALEDVTTNSANTKPTFSVSQWWAMIVEIGQDVVLKAIETESHVSYDGVVSGLTAVVKSPAKKAYDFGSSTFTNCNFTFTPKRD